MTSFHEKLQRAKEAAEKAQRFFIDTTDLANDSDEQFFEAFTRHPNQGPPMWQSNLKEAYTHLDPSFTLELIERNEALEKKLEKARKALESISRFESHDKEINKIFLKAGEILKELNNV